MIFNMVDYGPFTATVIAVCPSGTTSCILKKGSITLQPTSHSGTTYTFTVPETGSWVATASNGSKTTSGTAVISERNASKSITLSAYPVDPTPTPDPEPTYSTVVVTATATVSGNLFFWDDSGNLLQTVLGQSQIQCTVSSNAYYYITGSNVRYNRFYVPNTSPTFYVPLSN